MYSRRPKNPTVLRRGLIHQPSITWQLSLLLYFPYRTIIFNLWHYRQCHAGSATRKALSHAEYVLIAGDACTDNAVCRWRIGTTQLKSFCATCSALQTPVCRMKQTDLSPKPPSRFSSRKHVTLKNIPLHMCSNKSQCAMAPFLPFSRQCDGRREVWNSSFLNLPINSSGAQYKLKLCNFWSALSVQAP